MFDLGYLHLLVFAYGHGHPRLVSTGFHSPDEPRTVGAMRWERLFSELEAEAGELAQRDRDAEIADRTRAELARTRWADRVRASTGATVRLRLLGADLVEGTVLQVGADWLLLQAGANDVLVPAHAVVGVEGVGAASAPPAAARWRRPPGRRPGGCWPATARRYGWSAPVAARCTGCRCGWAPTSSSSTRGLDAALGDVGGSGPRSGAGALCRDHRGVRHSSNGWASMNSRVSVYSRWM